jgi:transposase
VRQFQQTVAEQVQEHAHSAQQRGYERWRLWAQDESRCGLIPIIRHRITARGVQPLVPSTYCFESLYLYGAVEPLTGDSFFLELPRLNTQCFQLFLDHFAATDPHTFHLLLLDNGAFHKAHHLRLPTNVGLLFFPPYAPELNPIERLWRGLKDWLANYHPTTLDELSHLLTTRLKHYTATAIQTLTGFQYLVAVSPPLNVHSS